MKGPSLIASANDPSEFVIKQIVFALFHSFLFGCIVAIASWTGQHCIDQGREATSNKFAFHIEVASEQKLDRLAELSACVRKVCANCGTSKSGGMYLARHCPLDRK